MWMLQPLHPAGEEQPTVDSLASGGLNNLQKTEDVRRLWFNQEHYPSLNVILFSTLN